MWTRPPSTSISPRATATGVSACAPAETLGDESACRSFGALDSANGQTVIDLLQRISRKHRTTVVCASHDPRLEAQSDTTLQMEDGRLRGDTALIASPVLRQLRPAFSQ